MKIREIFVEFKKGVKAIKHNKKSKDPAKEFAKAKEKLEPVKPMEEGITEDAEPVDREFALVKKLGRLGEMVAQNPKLWNRYTDAVENEQLDWIVGLIQDRTGADKDEIMRLANLFGDIGGGLGRITDFAWAVKDGTWQDDFMQPYREHRAKQKNMSERVRDPEDWDEGNTEPGNNFAVYINGRKWKVFPGPYGAYADSPEEEREFYRLKAMAHRKSEQTGKKWEVYKTGERATESIKETATPGATSAGNVAVLGMNPKLSPGPARGKKSYIGSPGKSGTKAPPQPKVKQPKSKYGTAKNALDMKHNIFGGGAIKRK